MNLIHQLKGAARRGRALFSRADRGPVLVVADLENLAYSAREAGQRLDLPGITEELVHAGASEFHSVASATPPMLALEPDLRAGGWTAHFRPLPPTRSARSASGNADSAVAAMAAGLCVGRRSAALVLLTGDGDLGADIAWSIGQIVPGIPICVVAFRLALSRRLTPAHNPYIARAFTIERRRTLNPATTEAAPRQISRAGVVKRAAVSSRWA